MINLFSTVSADESDSAGESSPHRQWDSRDGCLVDSDEEVEKAIDSPFETAEADALLCSYLRFSPDPIFVVDADGRFVYSNSGCRELFDRTVGELMDTNLFEYDNADNTAMRKVLDTGEPLCGLDQEIVTDDGETISVERYLYPLFDDTGTLVGGIEINRDVSERVSAQRREAQLEQLRAYQSDVAEEFGEWLAALSRGNYAIDPSVPEPDADFEDITAVYEVFDSMADNLGVAVDSTNDMLADVERGAAQLDTLSTRLGTAATETENAAARIDDYSTDAAATVSEQVDTAAAAEQSATDLSASIEEITATTQKISEQASQARSLADTGTESAETAVNRMDAAVDSAEENLDHVSNLEAQMENIEEMTEMIADIAEETNLLALNANIEAAHTDGDGDGFGVVADEIKTLAEESKTAVEEISETLDSLRTDIESTTAAIEHSSAEIEAGADAVGDVVDHIAEIDTAIEETETGIVQIADATDDQAENAQTVKTTVEAVADQSRQVDDHMTDISTEVDQQTENVDNVKRVSETIDTLSDDLHDDLSAFTLADTDEDE